MNINIAICRLTSIKKAFRRDSKYNDGKCNGKYNDSDNECILTSKRNAFICKYEDVHYVISSGHNINNNSQDILEINNLKVNLSNSFKLHIPEIDIVIYRINNIDIYDLNVIDLEDNKFTIDDINDKTDLFLLDQYNNLQRTNILFMEKSKYNNYCYPEMLKYFGSIKFKDIEGSSGSPIFDRNNNIYGVLSGYNEKYLNITPFFFIKRIIDEYHHYNNFSGLCNFWHDTVVMKRNLIIAKREDIDYNLYQKTLEKKIGKLIKDDIILKFDNKPIVNGMIHCDLINMEIDLDSYISITKTIHSINKLDIFRPKNLNHNYIQVITGNRDIYSAYNIDITEDDLVIQEINNMIYMKINPILFQYISNYRPIHADMKLLNMFKLKQSEMFDNNYLLVEDKNLNKNIFSDIPEKYLSVKV